MIELILFLVLAAIGLLTILGLVGRDARRHGMEIDAGGYFLILIFFPVSLIVCLVIRNTRNPDHPTTPNRNPPR